MSLSLPPLSNKSLNEQVYDHLRHALDSGRLRPGDALNPADMSRQLDVSRTPLRDALLRLEWEGFVRIKPRSGIFVRSLSLRVIRDLYQIIGSLEAAVLCEVFKAVGSGGFAQMRGINRQMRAALAENDFDAYYRLNLDWHDLPLSMTRNREIPRLISNHRRRLYDFPRRSDFVREWELNSVVEHDRFLDLAQAGSRCEAADYLRDVHWSFEVQEPFIRQYYPELADDQVD